MYIAVNNRLNLNESPFKFNIGTNGYQSEPRIVLGNLHKLKVKDSKESFFVGNKRNYKNYKKNKIRLIKKIEN